jgi:3'-5' exonuclease
MYKNYTNILFLDIETIAAKENYELLNDTWKSLWDTKAAKLQKDPEANSESIYKRAAIYAEFGKVICISCGILNGSGTNASLTIKSFYGHDEKKLLQDFIDMLNAWTPATPKQLCAHNGREFDFPYLGRRIIINHLKLPSELNLSNKKPWEVPHIDTMELWKFGDFKAYTSLHLLANALNIPTPKDDIDGSMVHDVYYQEQNLERIKIYCEKDVVTLAQIYCRLVGLPTIPASQINSKN